jgi:hypothetical protein
MFITVYFDQVSLDLYPSVAKRLKLTPGQQLGSIHQAIEVLNQNATHEALVKMARLRCQN